MAITRSHALTTRIEHSHPNRRNVGVAISQLFRLGWPSAIIIISSSISSSRRKRPSSSGCSRHEPQGGEGRVPQGGVVDPEEVLRPVAHRVRGLQPHGAGIGVGTAGRAEHAPRAGGRCAAGVRRPRDAVFGLYRRRFHRRRGGLGGDAGRAREQKGGRADLSCAREAAGGPRAAAGVGGRRGQSTGQRRGRRGQWNAFVYVAAADGERQARASPSPEGNDSSSWGGARRSASLSASRRGS